METKMISRHIPKAPPASKNHWRWPWHGWAGLLLLAVCWPLNWGLPGLRTHVLFFPLWLGYILVVDALTVRRRGDSLLLRSRRRFVGLFLVSAPAWWLFEVINWRTQNWHYQGRELFSNLEYAFMATISFSTVIPAVFVTAEWLSGFSFIRRFASVRPRPESSARRWLMLTAGVLLLALTLALPRYFFPFVWVAPYLITAAANGLLGHRTLEADAARGNMSPHLALALGALVCGFFWELWNFWSFPRWVYTVPFVGFARIFEMPLLGYGGYLPFGLELFALYHLVSGLLGGRMDGYLNLTNRS
jgi:hypothetical protein